MAPFNFNEIKKPLVFAFILWGVADVFLSYPKGKYRYKHITSGYYDRWYNRDKLTAIYAANSAAIIWGQE